MIPGHGLAIVGRSALVEFRDLVVDVRDRVRAMIVAGKTLPEVMAARPTAAYDARWVRRRGGPRSWPSRYRMGREPVRVSVCYR